MNPPRLLLILCLAGIASVVPSDAQADESLSQSAHKLKLAIEDLIETYGPAYPEGPKYLKQLAGCGRKATGTGVQTKGKLDTLRRKALLGNPTLLKLSGILVVQRKPKDPRSPQVPKFIMYRDIQKLSRHIVGTENHGFDSPMVRLIVKATQNNWSLSIFRLYLGPG